ncbi:general odorant-binding protein lush [Drosophila madeirensis]|uniref:General odorant-binding protein lush n=1 Tax=Drosophila madeirensis TaxID=30013 RepID=A0AAU9FNP6_DROMD
MKKYWKHNSSLVLAIVLLVLLLQQGAAVTMEQMMQSMDMLRGACQPKFKVTTEELDRMRSADFTMEHTKDLMCYTRCIAQMAGTVTKKGEFSATKAYAQLPIILPPEILEAGMASVDACRDVQKPYKDSCEKIFYTTKCMAEVDPSKFTFP